jgi:hypothetical protein
MIIAHRGDTEKYIENSKFALLSAIQKNTKCLELDINMIYTENQYIISHDRCHKLELKTQILTFDDFIKMIHENIELIHENIDYNGELIILLDLKLNKNELDNFMENEFMKYYEIIKNINNLTTIIQTCMIGELNDINLKNVETSYLICCPEQLYDQVKFHLIGLNYSLFQHKFNHVMIDIKMLNIINIFIIKIQLYFFNIQFNVYTINNYIIKKLLLLLNINVVTDNL